ncbi:MAG: hypothetical protein NZM35_04485 [Chitinophagales bacterium]|nr:hypothetical protein [Chitinophagales bacterium]MDW8418493.1 hypothetical protein [Chitinophagales bacterium]
MKNIIYVALAGIVLASCSTGNNWMSVANTQLNLTRENLEISKPISAEVKQTLVFGIDFKRLFKADWGTFYYEPGPFAAGAGGFALSSIPVIGTVLGGGPAAKVQGYAIAKLMADNPGYDCVIYPKYTQKTKNIIGIIVKTTGKIEARLGKIK